MNQEPETSADPAALRDQALNLRESVNSSRARLYAQREQLTRLRAELSALRALAATPPTGAAPASAPAPTPVPARAFAVPIPVKIPSVSMVAAADSAPAAAPSRTDGGKRTWSALPYAALLAAAVLLQRNASLRREAVPADPVVPIETAFVPPAPEAAFEDPGADQALLLAHDFRLPGDERPLAERLNAGANPPGSRPAWTAERTGDRTYRVRYQSTDDQPDYEFDVDLDARRVDPTPETAELIAPQLASRR
ncbi:MAG: hypothetical protein KGL74_01835 [Elusimicrobia bacterium]|nr:hypothetical protein [Elusimicrobiota bacterium]